MTEPITLTVDGKHGESNIPVKSIISVDGVDETVKIVPLHGCDIVRTYRFRNVKSIDFQGDGDE